MSNLPDQIRLFVQQQKMFEAKDRLLVAVSGGLDSVVLCHLCVSLGYDVVLAHCNFQLRGEESERDELFVRAFANQLARPLFVKKMNTNTYAKERGVSIQVAARELRYAWFENLLVESNEGEKPIQWILTAHHADDAIETSMMHFFRGTGIAGLRGIPAKNGLVCRPLLSTFRDALQAYASVNQLTWVEDSSNEKDTYTRNYLRHHFLPVVETIFPHYKQSMKDQLERFAETEAIVKTAIESFRKRWMVQDGLQWKIPVKVLQRQPHVRTMLFELVKPHGFSSAQLDDILHLLDASTGRFVATEKWQIVRHRDWLIVAPLLNPRGVQLIDSVPATIQLTQTVLQFQLEKIALPFMQAHPKDAFINPTKLEYPLMLRPWKEGDYFYPMGMRKKKKVARFLIDQKVSKPDKEAVMILESAGKIVWVVGYRIDDRFKCTDDSTETIWIKNLVL